MSRFFVPEKEIGPCRKVSIKGKEVRHIGQVLRLKKGERIEIFDGRGKEYLVLLQEVQRRKVTGKILKESNVDREPRVKITLAQSLPKANKMDLVVQKCVEMGASRIIPFLSKRTVVRVEEGKLRERRQRWQRIAEQASRQCGRSGVISVEKPRTYPEVLKEAKSADLALIPWERSRVKIKGVLKEKRKACSPLVLIGPEGGFSEEEIKEAKAEGVIPVSLGPRILRTETAGLAALAIILYELEG